MANLCIKQMQVMAKSFLSDMTIFSAEIFAGRSMQTIQSVYIVYQIYYIFFWYIFIKPSTKLGCKIEFAIRKSACAAKATHNITRHTAQTMINFFLSKRASAFIDSMPFFNYCHLEFRIFQSEFISSKYCGWSATNNRYIKHIVHVMPPKRKITTYIILQKLANTQSLKFFRFITQWFIFIGVVLKDVNILLCFSNSIIINCFKSTEILRLTGS